MGQRVTVILRSLSQLIRLPNLLIIILTQLLVRYCIMQPYLYADRPGLISSLPDFLILVLVTVLLAVGGYLINDYFDVKIDSINRPDRLVVNRLISGKTVIKLHLILNFIAIMLGFYLALRIKAISFGFIFPLISGLLWIYSAKYKRVTFWGNFIVSGLSAFVILIVWLFEFFCLRLNVDHFAETIIDIRWVTYLIIGYSTFAFLISMVREIIKDLEDAEGDKSVGCNTLTIAVGVKNTHYIVAAILVLTMLLLGYAQLVLYRLGMYMAFWYFLYTVQAGAVYFLIKLFLAGRKQDYHFLSSLCKLIMVAGILSMQIVYISN